MADVITTLSERGLAWLAALEGGYRLKAYKDSGGVWTISAGVIRWPDGTRIAYEDTLPTEAAAQALYLATLRPFVADVAAVTRDDLRQHEFDALISLCYNIGTVAFGRSTVLKRVNAGERTESIEAAWLWWCYDNGHPVPGLLTRRKREVEVFEGGSYRDQAGIAIGGKA